MCIHTNAKWYISAKYFIVSTNSDSIFILFIVEKKFLYYCRWRCSADFFIAINFFLHSCLLFLVVFDWKLDRWFEFTKLSSHQFLAPSPPKKNVMPYCLLSFLKWINEKFFLCILMVENSEVRRVAICCSMIWMIDL